MRKFRETFAKLVNLPSIDSLMCSAVFSVVLSRYCAATRSLLSSRCTPILTMEGPTQVQFKNPCPIVAIDEANTFNNIFFLRLRNSHLRTQAIREGNLHLGERAEGKSVFDFKKYYGRINPETASLDFLKSPKNVKASSGHFSSSQQIFRPKSEGNDFFVQH